MSNGGPSWLQQYLNPLQNPNLGASGPLGQQAATLSNLPDTHLHALVQHYNLPLQAPQQYEMRFGQLTPQHYDDALKDMTSQAYWNNFNFNKVISNYSAANKDGIVQPGFNIFPNRQAADTFYKQNFPDQTPAAPLPDNYSQIPKGYQVKASIEKENPALAAIYKKNWDDVTLQDLGQVPTAQLGELTPQMLIPKLVNGGYSLSDATLMAGDPTKLQAELSGLNSQGQQQIGQTDGNSGQ